MAKDKKDEKDSPMKVKPGKKILKDKKDLKQRAKDLLMEHPEILYNARDLFRNENGKTIPEERVPRGDVDQKNEICPRNQGDLTEEDLRSLAKRASSIVDEILLKYDPDVAYQDALQRAIHSSEDGKYQNRVNANTFSLILKAMKKPKKTEDKKSKEANEKTPDKEESKQEGIPMDKEALKKEIKAAQEKLAALNVLAEQEGIEVEAAETFKCPSCGTKVLKKTGFCVKCKKKVKEAGIETVESSDETNKDVSEEKAATEEKETNDTLKKVTASLDEVAQVLEEQDDPELLKLAHEIDKISDSLEGKEAATLEGDKDEPYMKQNFHAGVKESDADEKRYMNEFNTDTSTELKDKTTKKQLGKDASVNLPYQLKK